MKLLFCNRCGDVFSLSNEWKTCRCGKSQGKYINRIDVQHKGYSIPLGFNSRSFHEALKNRPSTGTGKEFVAFVIPREYTTIKHVPV